MSGEVLVFELKPQPWMRQANCVDADPALFFPERGEPSAPAKAICLACPVRVECLNYALSINERHGIWGGTSENERRVLRRQWTGTRRRRDPPTPTRLAADKGLRRDPADSDGHLGGARRGRRMWSGRA